MKSSYLNKNTIVIGLVSLLSDISTEMAYPLLPIFIKEVLKAPATALGLIEGIANGTASIATGLSGWFSDRLGRRKPVAFSGYSLTALSKPFIAAATNWPLVLAARFTDRLGKGIRSAPKDALIAETASEQDRGRAYGFERTMDYSGAVAGPLIGLAIFAALGVERMRWIFLIASAPATLAALLILLLREKNQPRAEQRQSARLTLRGTTRDYKYFLVASALFGLANSANAFLILRAQDLGLSSSGAVLGYTVYNAVAAVASLPAGQISDRLGRRDLLVIGYALYAAVYLGFGLGVRGWLIWTLFATYGLYAALTDGAGKALAVDTAGRAGRGTAIGVYSAVNGGTQVVASYIAGVLWDSVQPSATFYFGAALSAASVLALLLTLPGATRRRGERRRGEGFRVRLEDERLEDEEAKGRRGDAVRRGGGAERRTL